MARWNSVDRLRPKGVKANVIPGQATIEQVF